MAVDGANCYGTLTDIVRCVKIEPGFRGSERFQKGDAADAANSVRLKIRVVVVLVTGANLLPRGEGARRADEGSRCLAPKASLLQAKSKDKRLL